MRPGRRGRTLSADQTFRRSRFLFALLLGLCLTNQGCQRKSPNESKAGEKDPSEPRVVSSREVYATWYDVPLTSLAKRRAGLQEMTAAHNHLPLGTRVRVTHLAHHKSVVVRITDRGITKPRIKLDLCKEAAHELDMISEGVAHVRMEVLADDPPASSPTPDDPLPNK